MKRFSILALLLVICSVSVVWAQTAAPVQATALASALDQVYDQFKGKFLDSSKWLTMPTCSATPFVDTTASINLLDCAREIQSNKLRLMVRVYGNMLSDIGRQFGPSELYFVNPNAVNSITTTLSVKRAKALACPANPDPITSSISQAIFGGTYFNPGSGDFRDDVGAAIVLEHKPSTPAGVMTVSALVISPNVFYGFLGLGTIRVKELLTASVRWDQPSHQFIFHATGPNLNSTVSISYSVPDTMPPAVPVKLLGARAFAPNCTTRQATADVEVLFDNVRVN